MSEADLIAPHLEADERILWSQRAPQRAVIRGNVWPIGFMIVWLICIGAWAIATVHAVIESGGRNIFGLALAALAVGMFLYGLYFGAPFLLNCFGPTYYALTNRRVIRVARGLSWEHEPEEFAHMQRLNARDGAATILFDYGPSGRRGSGFRGRLFGIADPIRVERLIRATLFPLR